MSNEDYSNIKYMEYESGPALKDTKRYFGKYRGINYEINNFHIGTMPSWTHYIILHIDDQLSEKSREKFWLTPRYTSFSEGGVEHLSYDYWDSIIADIEFHGGCTWYSKESSVDAKRRSVKIGCDYQHIWDEGMQYDLDYVYNEVKKTIDSLIELVGPIKIRSFGDGKYRYHEEFAQ